MNANQNGANTVENQVALASDGLIDWIVGAEHIRPNPVITAPSDIHTLHTYPSTPTDAAKRMADEFAFMDAIIVVLQDTKIALLDAGARPLTYEQDLAKRINTLCDPMFLQVLRAYSRVLWSNGQNPDMNWTIPYARQIDALITMLERIQVVASAFPSLFATY